MVRENESHPHTFPRLYEHRNVANVRGSMDEERCGGGFGGGSAVSSPAMCLWYSIVPAGEGSRATKVLEPGIARYIWSGRSVGYGKTRITCPTASAVLEPTCPKPLWAVRPPAGTKLLANSPRATLAPTVATIRIDLDSPVCIPAPD